MSRQLSYQIMHVIAFRVDVGALLHTLDEAVRHDGPVVVVAHTVKGKGVSFMEGQAAWHGKPISDDDYALAIKELKEAR